MKFKKEKFQPRIIYMTVYFGFKMIDFWHSTTGESIMECCQKDLARSFSHALVDRAHFDRHFLFHRAVNRDYVYY